MSDINITAINPRTRRVTFAFQIVPKKTSGMETLLQLSAKTVLTTPGIDIFAPEYGGGLMNFAGKNLNTNELPRIYADIAYIIRKSEENIIKEQMGMKMPKAELLRSLTLLSIEYIQSEAALDVRVLVTAENGESADISLANQIRFKRDETLVDPMESVWRLYNELTGTDRAIMEYLYAYNGKPLLTAQEIADKFNLTLSYVIDIRNRLSVRLKELQS